MRDSSPKPGRLPVVIIRLLVAAACLAARPASAQPLLQGLPTLSRAYDHVLNARATEAERELTRCADAPRVACQVLQATNLWWRIQLDPLSHALDEEFSKRVDEAIDAATAWTTREPQRGEAWFYLGAAYGARVQFRVLRTQRLAAARDGKHIKDALETALRFAPSLEDANFGVGLYQYYADVAPTAAKVLRWLLLLPGGNKVEGLARMLRARDRGQVVWGEATYQLHVIYLWYEKDFARALQLAQDLASHYPQNPLFPKIIADTYDVYFHDPTASAREYEHLLALARDQRVQAAALAEAQARLGLADLLDGLFESDRAVEQARAVISARPSAPYAATARAWLAAGRAYRRMGQMAESRQAFAQALSTTPPDDATGIRDAVKVAERTPVNARAADAYRLALSGWRAYERQAMSEANAQLARAASLNPGDMVTHYRYGRVLAAQGRLADARREGDIVASHGATTPPFVYAEACVALARAIEEAGDRDRAADLYRRASYTFGAFHETRSAAARAASRLTTRPK